MNPVNLTKEELHELIENRLNKLWLQEKPSLEARAITDKLPYILSADDKFNTLLVDNTPLFVWTLIDIAVQRGIDAGRKHEEK